MLSIAEIKSFIDDDISSEKKRLAGIGERYYDGKHDILNSRLFYFNADGKLVEDNVRANAKISHKFFTILAEQLADFLLSFKKNPIQAKDKVDGLQEHLDLYFNSKFWAEFKELVTGAYVKGFEYIYCFKNPQRRLTFQCADSMGVVEVRAKDTDDQCEYIIYWYVDRIEKGKKQIKRIQVWDSKETRYYVQSGNDGQIVEDDSVPFNPRPHVVYTDKESGQKKGYGLGVIPFWKLTNNKKEKSGIWDVKDKIDDYDRHCCSLSNNLVDFDTPIYFVTGFDGQNLDELQQNLRTKKVLGVSDDGKLEIKTVDIPVEARKTMLEIDKEAIFLFGMGYDPTKVGDGNITNIVIKSRYSMLELKAKNMRTRSQALLDDIVPIVLADINKENGTDYQMSDVKYDFPLEIMSNETENVQIEKTKAETKQIQINIVLNVAMQIGDEEVLKRICDILELDYDEVKAQVEKQQKDDDTANAKALLNEVVTEDNE